MHVHSQSGRTRNVPTDGVIPGRRAAESPESITTRRVWIPGSPSLRYGAPE
jgi:hypothetical protein